VSKVSGEPKIYNSGFEVQASRLYCLFTVELKAKISSSDALALITSIIILLSENIPQEGLYF
jgi:hypothetical protein